MPSMISLEDLKAKLYEAGVRNPRKLNEMTRHIVAYTVQEVRKGVILEDVPEPVFTPLKPGEWSRALEITCCASCNQVKRWDYYHLDARHATGHKTTCKDCRNALDEAQGKPPYIPDKVRRGGWICISCRERRAPAEYPQAKRDNPRGNIPCLYCEDEKK